MKSREVTFYADPEVVAVSVDTIEQEILPSYVSLPHFLGYVVMQEEPYPGRPDPNGRRLVTVISFWADGLEPSESAARRFIDEINRVAGTNPTRKNFDLLKAMWCGSDGQQLAQFP